MAGYSRCLMCSIKSNGHTLPHHLVVSRCSGGRLRCHSLHAPTARARGYFLGVLSWLGRTYGPSCSLTPRGVVSRAASEPNCRSCGRFCSMAQLNTDACKGFPAKRLGGERDRTLTLRWADTRASTFDTVIAAQRPPRAVGNHARSARRQWRPEDQRGGMASKRLYSDYHHSLFTPKEFPVPLRKFPVPLRRGIWLEAIEFHC
jgi:hypothetical protein